MPFTLSQIDHLVYTAPILEQGIDEIEALLGMRPVIAGQHPDFGTHNALLSLGGETYLEVIAPDPSLPKPPKGYMFQIDPSQPSRLATWALRTEAIHHLAEAASQQGLELGDISSGSRKKPDGSVLEWQLSDPYCLPFGGVIPFLLSWGNTPHPAASLPQVGTLLGFEIEHPAPESIRSALEILETQLPVRQAETARLVATIRTREGTAAKLS